MNLLFAGTPAFAVPALAALQAAGHRVLAVYTQPDRPAGRGRHLNESAVKQYAKSHGLEVRQPPDLKGCAREIAALAPDAMIVIAYGVLLPPDILAIPKHGCINVHGSLLPRWRGAAPIARALEAGDSVTGVTIMQMDAGLDTGPMLLKRETPIDETDTATTLHDRLSVLGAGALIEALERLERGALSPETQDNALACYARKLRKEEGIIDWTQPATVLARRVRAFNPWPVANTRMAGRGLRVWEAHSSDDNRDSTPGTIVSADANGINVACGSGMLILTRVQAEGGNPLSAAEFLNGHRLRAGDRLGTNHGAS
ncbi:MAG: methionyl-tRNA formyltransferase [Acidithiobacillales bacterium SM23_46]|jgi:methionyl-tRNA formyltransferase|nr:MAG: methionyl-tRNA formyltransferase [Acidithiobacillales bacterium SM23_46]